MTNDSRHCQYSFWDMDKSAMIRGWGEGWLSDSWPDSVEQVTTLSLKCWHKPPNENHSVCRVIMTENTAIRERFGISSKDQSCFLAKYLSAVFWSMVIYLSYVSGADLSITEDRSWMGTSTEETLQNISLPGLSLSVCIHLSPSCIHGKDQVKNFWVFFLFWMFFNRYKWDWINVIAICIQGCVQIAHRTGFFFVKIDWTKSKIEE